MPGHFVQVVGETRFKEFICPVCELLLKDAIQLEDGRRICLSCYDENQHTERNNSMDYMDGLHGEASSSTSTEVIEKAYFPDWFARRVVSEIQVYCNFKKSGCDWTGSLQDHESHIEACDKRPSICEKCDKTILPCLIEHHMAEECRERNIKCEFCDEKLKASSLEDHAKICNRQPKPCDECDMILQPEQMIDHKKIWCQNSTGVCPFTDEGCDHDEVMDKQGLLQHLKDNLIYHILVLLGHLKIITRMVVTVQSTLSTVKDDIYDRVEALTDMVKNIQSKVLNWTEYMEKQLQNQSIAVEDTRRKTFACESSLENIVIERDKYQKNLTDIESRTVAHESQIQEQLTAFSEAQRLLHQMSDRVEALRAEIYEIRKSQHKVLGLAPKNGVHIPVHPPLDSSDYIIPYNGELTWKISDFTRMRKEAILNRTRSFYSPPFYTSSAGTKCCGRVYMNGDGPAKGTHISLFFVVMKGPYDALQRWPFDKKITLMLLNQDGESHYEESFKPDVSSSSFERPKNDANIASGSPFFYDLRGLESNGFLKDDTIFIRIKVAA